MKLQHRVLLIVLIVLYMLSVRHAFGWLAGHGPVTARFPHDLMSALPYAVALLCVVGLSFRNAWAWWLTLAAVLFELVTFGRGLPHFLAPTLHGMVGLFKLVWLLAMGGLLLIVRR